MLATKIHCAVIINSNKIEKANKLFDGFRNRSLDVAIKNYTIKLYWKDAAKHRAEFDFEIESNGTGNLLEKLLTILSGISTHWHFALPSDLSSEKFEMSCVCDKVNVNGIEWINFEAYQTKDTNNHNAP